MFYADPLAERVVGLDQPSQLSTGIDGGRQLHLMARSKFLREGGQVFRAFDRRLIGKDFVPVFTANCLAFGIEPAGVDGRGQAPAVEGQREVVADEGDLIFGYGLIDHGIGVGAVRAVKIEELDDGHTGAGGRLERRGVVNVGSVGRRAKLTLRRAGQKRNNGKTQSRYAKTAHRGGGRNQRQQGFHGASPEYVLHCNDVRRE